MTNLLFVCSRNQWRSPTAEAVWRRQPGVAVRSAGTSASARHTVTEGDIRWADVVFVMEQSHKTRIQGFASVLESRPVHVLGIPDEYRYMDPELVEMIEDLVGEILKRNADDAGVG